MQAYPLQLISAPTAPDSRQLKPNALAVIPHARNLEKKATTQMRMVYPQVTPLLSRPRLVLNPVNAKYCKETCEHHHRPWPLAELTRGMKISDTRSSSFSTRAIAYPLSWGMINPARNPPKMAWMPMTSVKNAEMNTMTSVMVIIVVVGVPFSRLPVRRHSHLYAILTGKRRKRV